jgi:Fe-Mn family superoxide dismutase
MNEFDRVGDEGAEAEGGHRSAFSRRDAIAALAVGGAALVAGCATNAQAAPGDPAGQASKPAPGPAAQKTPSAPPATPQAAGAEPALAGNRPILSLPFDPRKLQGISERMIVSHHDNNYAGAVKNLNRVEGELARTNKDTPAFVVGGLRQSELTFRNSATLHEAYFANLGGDGRASGAIGTALAGAHGSFGRWEEHFRATGASLGGGSGWVVLALDLFSGDLRTFWSGNHTQALASAAPLLVMDMYEHAYQMDYGAAAAKYIDVFFQNISWDEVNRRFEKAKRASAALRGG